MSAPNFYVESMDFKADMLVIVVIF